MSLQPKQNEVHASREIVTDCNWPIAVSTFGNCTVDVRYVQSLRSQLTEAEFEERAARLHALEEQAKGGAVSLVFGMVLSSHAQS